MSEKLGIGAGFFPRPVLPRVSTWPVENLVTREERRESLGGGWSSLEFLVFPLLRPETLTEESPRKAAESLGELRINAW